MNYGDHLIQVQTPSLELWRKRTATWLIRRAFGKATSDVAPAPLPRRGIHRILVCRVSHTLGNTLLVTPLIRELERVYPGAEIDIVTRSPVADEVFGKFPRVRTVFSLPRHGVSSPRRVASVLRALRARRYDLAIDPGVLSRSDRMYVMAANATWKIGYAKRTGSGLTQTLPMPAQLRHVGQLPVHLLRAALGDDDHAAYPALDLALTPTERAWGRSVLNDLVGSDGPILGIFATATDNKHLGATWWRSLAACIAGARPKVRLLEIIPVTGHSALDNRLPTYFSTDLRRLAAVLSGLSLYVSADCGVMHLACAAGVSTVGLFKGTDIAEWGPYGPRNLALDVTSMPPEAVADRLIQLDELANGS